VGDRPPPPNITSDHPPNSQRDTVLYSSWNGDRFTVVKPRREPSSGFVRRAVMDKISSDAESVRRLIKKMGRPSGI
jgi:hypothetical protein